MAKYRIVEKCGSSVGLYYNVEKEIIIKKYKFFGKKIKCWKDMYDYRLTLEQAEEKIRNLLFVEIHQDKVIQEFSNE